MLDALHEFCVEYDMAVNVNKTEIVVFGRRQYDKPENLRGRWQYAGMPVPVSVEFKYLGVVLHCTKGVSAAIPTLAAAGKWAMWAMLQRVGDMQLESLMQKVQLFDAVVAPILNYCSEVWGPGVLAKCFRSDSMLDNELQRVQMLFLRCIAGNIRRSSPRLLLLREFGCNPLVRYWIQYAVDLWNRVCGAGQTSLLHQCMLDDWVNRTDNRYGIKTWACQFCAVLQHIGVDTSVLTSVADGVTRLQPLDHSEVLLKFDEWFALKWSGLPADPRIASSNQVLYATYESWFASCQLPQVSQLPEESQHGANTVCAACPDHIQRSAGINVAHMSSLLRFRLGCHDLPVAVGRWGTRHITRESRVCDRCESGTVGDEFHMVFRVFVLPRSAYSLFFSV
jgi:hypothetical protein